MNAACPGAQGCHVGVLKESRDWLLIMLALAHGMVLFLWPGIMVVALGTWWNSNTISHYFIHRPFFKARWANRLFQLYETVLIGVPQTLWRERHLAHHSERPWRLKWSGPIGIEVLLLAGLWGVLLVVAPGFFGFSYLPGLGLGLILCQWQGYFEHRRGTTSHYSWLYNFLFLNDGYHVEHHLHPWAHWRELPKCRVKNGKESHWPAILRCLDWCSLVSLEKLLLKSRTLQRFVLARHEQALRKALAGMEPKKIMIVGGGLFPRSALVLGRIFPDAELIVLEKEQAHIETARSFLEKEVEFECRRFEGEPLEADLVVLPLSFKGDVHSAIANQSAPVVVHEWLGTPSPGREIVSLLLWKQVSVRRSAAVLSRRGDRMKIPVQLGASAFVVAALAKVVWLSGQEVDAHWSVPFIYFWQDACAALAVGVVCLLMPVRWVRLVVYLGFATFTALNLPLQKVLFTPFTWNMLGAAQGTLADSIKHHLTITNLLLISLVMAGAVLAPIVLRHLRSAVLNLTGAGLAALAVAGFFLGRNVYTEGMERNAWVAFIQSTWARTAPVDATDAWRTSPFEKKAGEELGELGGIARGRNVVLIVLESTGANYLKSWGAKVDSMPNLSGLAEKSIIFENAYAVYPESIKGLFSLMFSTAPAIDLNAEQHVNGSGSGRSLADELRTEGYDTGLFHSGRFMYLGMDAVVESSGFDQSVDAGGISGKSNSSFGVDEPATVEAMLNWLDGREAGKPFFLTYLPIAGHHPYDTPKPGPFPGDAEESQYLNALHYADEALGDLLAGLQERGLLENSLLVIVGDHGEAFGQHSGNYGHTLALYEENVRVPLLIAAPGLIESQTRVTRVASMIDLGPTILALLGQSPPQGWEGTSLLEPGEQMALFFTDYSLRLAGLRDGDFKFIHDLGAGHSKFYDLRTDPAEKIDISEKHRDRGAIYREHLRRWIAAQKHRVQFGRDSNAATKRRPRSSG